MTSNNSSIIDNYIFIQDKHNVSAKRVSKKFRKNGYRNAFTNIFSTPVDYFESFNTYLDSYKIKSPLGILIDSNVPVYNIAFLPPPPLKWDVLFLECDISKYHFTNQNNNIYWCKVESEASGNFVINFDSISKIKTLIKDHKIRDWTKFFNTVTTSTECFCVTQYFFSENTKQYNRLPIEDLKAKNLSHDGRVSLLKNYNEQYSEILRNAMQTVNISTRLLSHNSVDNSLLPKVSLISVVEDTQTFFRTVYSFLKLNYPSDKLELIIVDCCNAEKVLKNVLPNDSRIKMINLNKKPEATNNILSNELQLGYKLNMGIKYSSHELVCHFFENTLYHFSFKDLIVHYLLSGKDCVMSCDTGIYNRQTKKSYNDNTPSMSTMLYSKLFWKAKSFDDSEIDKKCLLYKFIHSRTRCISWVPFTYMGFVVTEFTNIEDKQELEVDLYTLVDSKLQSVIF